MSPRFSSLTRILRRAGSTVLVLLGVSIVTFVIAQMVPNDTARLIAGDLASDARVAEVRAELGLDRPLPVQYLTYMARLANGDLGLSIRSGRPVAEELAEALPATVELAAVAFAMILVAGLVLGSLSALTAGRWPDYLIRLLSTLAISAPTFWIGLVLLAIFFGSLDWLPSGGRLGPELMPPPAVTGLYLVDGALAGEWQVVGDALAHLLLPAITLGTVWTFNNLNIVWLVSNGGEPADQTHILVSYVYKAVFNLYQYGYGAALSMIIFALLLAFSLVFLQRTRATEAVGG